MNVIGDKAEQWRHQTVSNVGAGHLDADQSMRMLCAEMLRGGVDNTRVNGGAAEANEDESHDGSHFTQWQKHGANAQQDHYLAHADELRISKFHGQKSI